MNAKIERLRVLALQAPLERLSRWLGKTDEATVSGRSPRRLPELRAFVLDGSRLLFDGEELNDWLFAKADEYHGRGDCAHSRMMNAGRVDGYWTVAGEIQELQRALASAGEAGTATTVQQGVVHEHATRQGDAQDQGYSIMKQQDTRSDLGGQP